MTRFDPSSEKRPEMRPQPPIPSEYRPELRPQPPIPSAPTPRVLTVDLASDPLHVVQQTISQAATTSGFCFIRNLPMTLDFAAVQRVFDRLYQSPLTSQINAAGHAQGLGRFFHMGGKWAGDVGVDDKASMAMNTKKLNTPQGQRIKQRLGPDFQRIAAFFERVEQELVPLVLQATSDAIANSDQEKDLWDVHRTGNVNFRLIDYHRTPTGSGQGAREHRDGSTATIIFQDQAGGLDVQDCETGEWIPVPGGETVVMWGRAGGFFSGERVKAVMHRVRNVFETRRNSAVCFVGPDLEAKLQPVVGEGERGELGVQGFNQDGGVQMTVGDLRELIRYQRMNHRQQQFWNHQNQGRQGQQGQQGAQLQQEVQRNPQQVNHYPTQQMEPTGTQLDQPQRLQQGNPQQEDPDWSFWGPGHWRGGGMGRGMGRGRGRGMGRGGLENRIVRGMGRRMGRAMMNQGMQWL